MGLQLQRGKFTKTRAGLLIAIAIALLAIPFSTHLQTFKAYADESPFQTPRFINSSHYMRANTVDDGNPATLDDHDIVAEIEFYEGTERIELYIDDQPVGEPANTLDQTALNQGDQTDGEEDANKIVIRMPFAPGLHTMRGVAYFTDGSHVDMDGSSVIYALDTEGAEPGSPMAQYVLPTDETQVFKSSANPVKVKIDDEFSQFANAELALLKGTSENPGELVGTFALSRADCEATDDRFIYCNIDRASGWPSLDEGTYFVKLKTSTKAETPAHRHGIAFDDQTHWSHSFVIDNTPPAVTIGGPFSVIGGEDLTLNGTVDGSVTGATVYIDGKAKGLAALNAGTWTYDIPTDLKLGDHQVGVSAVDAAGNESDPEASMTLLTVKPFVPPVTDVTPVAQAATGLTDPFPIVREREAELNQTAVTKPQESDMAILRTAKAPTVDQNVIPITPTSEGWKLFGIAWYWLLGIPATIGAGVWGISRLRASSDTVPSFIADPEDI